MKVLKSERGFPYLAHEKYTNKEQEVRIVAQSSAIGEYEDSFDKPGSSFLWIGDDVHLNREEVRQLIKHLESWLKTGSLKIEDPFHRELRDVLDKIIEQIPEDQPDFLADITKISTSVSYCPPECMGQWWWRTLASLQNWLGPNPNLLEEEWKKAIYKIWINE